jgi:hypothetical protein
MPLLSSSYCEALARQFETLGLAYKLLTLICCQRTLAPVGRRQTSTVAATRATLRSASLQLTATRQNTFRRIHRSSCSLPPCPNGTNVFHVGRSWGTQLLRSSSDTVSRWWQLGSARATCVSLRHANNVYDRATGMRSAVRPLPPAARSGWNNIVSALFRPSVPCCVGPSSIVRIAILRSSMRNPRADETEADGDAKVTLPPRSVDGRERWRRGGPPANAADVGVGAAVPVGVHVASDRRPYRAAAVGGGAIR